MDIVDRNKMSETLAVIRALDESLRRQLVPAKSLRFRNGHLVVGERSLGVDDEHFRSLCDATAAPPGYLRYLGEPYTSYLLSRQFTRGDHLNQLAKQRLLGLTRRHKEEVCVVSRDGRFVGFGRPDLQTLRAADVLHAVTNAAKRVFHDKFDNFILKHSSIDADGFSIDLVIPASRAEIRVGDVVNGGFHVSHSFIASHATRIETYIHRLMCSNGAIKRECLSAEGRRASRIRRRTTNRLDAVDISLKGIEEYALRLASRLHANLAAIPELCTQRVTNVRQFVERQLQQVPRLHSKRLVDRIVDAFSREPEDTAYGVFNAMTWVATHTPSNDLRPTVRDGLTRLSGILGTRAHHICPHCFRMVGQG
jgi:hypothetical protein